METLYSEKINRKNNLDFFRFIFATTVVISHSYVIYYSTANNFEPLWIFSETQLGFGTLALNFFFIISGFLILKSWHNRVSFLSFLINRILRIYPAFTAVCLICAFIFSPLGNGTQSQPFQEIKEYWAHINILDLIYNIFRLRYPTLPETLKTLPIPNVMNASVWTIPYEFKCYILVIVFSVLNIYKNKIYLLILFFIVFIVNIIHYKPYQLYNVYNIVDPSLIPYFSREKYLSLLNLEHFLLFFLSGALFYFYHNYIPRSFIMLIVSLFFLLFSLKWMKFFELFQSIFGSYVLFYFAFSKKIKFHNFAKYGDFSYGIYLYGWPIQQLVLLYLGQRLNLLGIFAISFTIIMFFSVFSWYLIEKPFLSLKGKTFQIDFLFKR